ncbi:hypothetical protein ACFP1I_08385 [Dyadobacter subterraneus]|uniref:Uncharacterized protein n=1 Tax=Dyadobacter subterraneus TaxID=2773304 RepID=A0ABR9WEJ2_9BACT|nr:hypothetical protein [Dyadobacter subterraneus]MBE9463847.1 hypothetical protein [Dyadobacter subterraneus]
MLWEIQHGKTFLLPALLLVVQPELDLLRQSGENTDRKALIALLSTGVCMLSFVANIHYPVLGIKVPWQIRPKRTF